jgi:polysaccharide export outer membrane protein
MKRFLVVAAILMFVGSVAAIGASRKQPAGSQEAARFYVTGFVKSPGAYQHETGMSVQLGIAVAGGLTDRGSNRGIKILRKVEGRDTELDVDLSAAVLPNDTIRVRQRLQ